MTVLKPQKKEKKQKFYTNEEKLSLVRQYLQSGLSLANIAKSIGISHSGFRKWLCKFGNPDLPKMNELMEKANIPSTVEELQKELIELRKQRKCMVWKEFQRQKL